MRKTLTVAACLLISTTSYSSSAAVENAQKWTPYGSSGAIVLPKNDAVADSSFQGLVVECFPSSGLARINVKDIKSKKGDSILWETERETGVFINNGFMFVRTDSRATDLNDRLVQAMKNGEWIQFKNTDTGSSATYTLNGSAKAIDSITTCKTYHQ